MKIDITILKEFLEHSGCGLYFTKDPFVIAGHTAKINDIEDSTLIRWIGEYNSTNYEDNGPQMGHKGEESHE
jgi:hypothetical protein